MKQFGGRLKRLRWSTILGGVLAILFFAAAVIIFWRDGRTITEQINRIDYRLLALSFLIEVTGWLLAVPIWKRIVTQFDGSVSLSEHFRIYAYSMLGVAVPGRFWGMVGRVVLYERKGVARFQIAVAAVVEYLLIGLGGLLVFGLTTAVSGFRNLWQRPIVAIACISLAFLLVQPPLFNRLTAWVLKRSRKGETMPKPINYRDLIAWLLVESSVILIGGTAVYVLFVSLFTASSPLYLLIISAWAAAAVAGNLFFWIPGPVIRDGFMTAILASVLSGAQALFFVIVVRVWTIGSIFVLVAIVWTLSQLGSIQENQLSAQDTPSNKP